MWQMHWPEDFGTMVCCSTWQSVLSCQATCRRQEDYNLWAERKLGTKLISALIWVHIRPSIQLCDLTICWGQRYIRVSSPVIMLRSRRIPSDPNIPSNLYEHATLCFFCSSGSRWGIWLAQSLFSLKKVCLWLILSMIPDDFLLLVCVLKCVALQLLAKPHSVNGLSSGILSPGS